MSSFQVDFLLNPSRFTEINRLEIRKGSFVHEKERGKLKWRLIETKLPEDSQCMTYFLENRSFVYVCILSLLYSMMIYLDHDDNDGQSSGTIKIYA